MTTGMLQDTIHTLPSGSGPRFRPYACPNHHVTKGRYITSNDSRGYIPVYEYPLNGQWIMMDIDDGYILWTGIWKALGNSKADIVKMIDSQPDLAPLIRRVRGGYLKIQGTWMPYEVALKLSRRVAWTIRDDLVPLFGPTFPSTCLSPDQPGYGQVVPTGQNKRRPRRTARNSIMEMPRAPGWTVVTPTAVNIVAQSIAAATTTTTTTPFHHPTVRSHKYSPDIRLSPISNSVTIKSNPSYHGGYNSNSYSYRNPQPVPSSPSSKTSVSLDLAFRDGSSERVKEEFNLPPIDSNNSSPSPYSLPPISSIEGTAALQDSATVLRRLRMDDDSYNKSDHQERTTTTTTWGRRHSLSIHSSSPSRPIETSSSRFQPYNTSRSYQDRSFNTAPSYHHHHRAQTRSDISHEGDSTSNPSPTSPTTPNSALSEYGSSSNNSSSLYMMKGQGTEYPDRHHHHQWSSTTATRHHHGRIMIHSPEDIISVRRNSFSDGDANQPHRPW